MRDQSQEALNNSFTSQQLAGEGKSNYFLFTAGCLFEKNKQRYLLTEITHHAFDYSYLPKEEQQERCHLTSGLVQHYHNHFKHLSANFSYASKSIHKKNRLAGIYPAFVMAPDGQDKEIYTNELGDIQVSFPWQHKGEHTPFIPVMHTVAGHNFGNQFIPRVGEEVWVAFQEGDPELPIVLGSAPNAITVPAFDLEENPNLTWIKTKTLKQEANNKGHHLVFDDTPHHENISLHVEGNYLEEILRDSLAEIEEEEVFIHGADLLEALNSEIRLEAKRIILSGGGSEIILSEHGLEIKGSAASGGRVNLFSCGGGAIRPIVRVGDKYDCPKMTAGTPHHGGSIIQGSSIVSTKGHAIARQGDKGACFIGQDQIKEGINSVLVDDKPIACLQRFPKIKNLL